MTIVTPLAFRVAGRNLLSINERDWKYVISQFGGLMVGMPYRWRWISVSRPASLDGQRRQIRAELDVLTRPEQIEARQATLMQLHDMERDGIHDISHYLLAWPETAQQRQSLPALLQSGIIGRVIPLSSFPNVFGAKRYTTTGHVLQSVDGHHAWRGFLSAQFPGSASPMMFRSILSQTFPVILVVDVASYSQADARNKIYTAMNGLGTSFAMFQEFNAARNAARDDIVTAARIIEQGSLLHEVQIAVLVAGETEDSAILHGQQIKHTLDATIHMRPLEGYQKQIGLFATPRHTHEIRINQRPHNLVTHQLAPLVPAGIATDRRDKGLLLGRDKTQRHPLRRELAKIAAKHACIVGISGSGKSTLATVYAHRLVDEQAVQVIVIDPQENFHALAATHPGSSFNRVSLYSQAGHKPLTINVLDPIVDNLEIGLVEQVEHVQNTISMLNREPLTPTQSMQLSRALTKLYKGLYGMPLDDAATIPLLSDLVAIIDRELNNTGLQDIIAQWIEPPLDSVFNRPTTLDLRMVPTTPVIIYEIDRNMPERFKRFFTTLICAAIQRQVRRTPREGIIIMDEAGVLLKDPIFENFAENMAKTIRAYGLGLWIVDQTLELLKTHAGKEIFQNTFITVIGLMKTDQGPLLQELFPMLTDAQRRNTIGIDDDEETIERMAGHFTLVLNNKVFEIYNDLSPYERRLITVKKTIHAGAGGV
ncbi:helicase HerA domain-containing protein [Herpetosiphon geysericola]|uniref:AAA+ ATPase domain-containing protein n=1 Tax=Herpetosiphon geysericola TaxID=70996 RepID=A0A0P6Y4I1_9CHLR|nr:DUF87 domain-containing protein [Herpetosiphon geysericola]KPL79956.1 hypothetical protein SE18_25540 [Herpetosiphon geysericola]